ncbi:hypothetical protein FHX81_1091 [Saccharothrix saharensis]|uniref:Uncharacterized protein n=1 Tax=Saccharothrix saharensis TaxID=571190 RepID=A0A543J7L3_9PSEU|nr:hypothetical protein [Saccharothrix saharensis]TQM78810.1 hypothetical protein FHX81_1091 [Saccharothrix saharensis]
MTKLLLSVHVIAAILAVGPIAVAASLFPRFAREPTSPVAAFLHRTCRTYTAIGVAVPVFGVATGASLGVLGDTWLLASVVLTAVAAGLLALSILPAQRRALDGATGVAKRLAMTTGVFNLLWAVVVVLMIVRPGSTTGA